MEYEDRVRIATPEGVELEIELAGIGSRLTARLVDVAIEAVAIFLAVFVFDQATDDSSISGALSTALAILLAFLVFWSYDILFEAFNAGQTPGKRWNRLRVIGARGEPESLSMAAVRNLMRLVDEVLTLFLGALISILRSERNQRLGDIAAGTLVVREREPLAGDGARPGVDQARLERAAAWDTTAISDSELITVRQFLERRDQIMPHARAHLAAELATKLRPRVPGADASAPEEFLELLAAIKARRG